VNYSLDEDLWPAIGDRVQFEVALLNLAGNARDAMPPGGKLAVATRNVTPPGGCRSRSVARPVRTDFGDRHRRGHERRNQGARFRPVL
jgi:signal transduction histidine kinase